MKNSHDTIEGRIRHFRCENGLTQEEVGEKIGVNPQTVQSFEWGLKVPSETQLRGMAELFSCTYEQLIDLKNYARIFSSRFGVSLTYISARALGVLRIVAYKLVGVTIGRIPIPTNIWISGRLFSTYCTLCGQIRTPSRKVRFHAHLSPRS